MYLKLDRSHYGTVAGGTIRYTHTSMVHETKPSYVPSIRRYPFLELSEWDMRLNIISVKCNGSSAGRWID
jgi:hypothetical protein